MHTQIQEDASNSSIVQEAVELLRCVNRSNLSGLTALYAWFVEHQKDSTIHGTGFQIPGHEEWLSIRGVWSGDWQIQLVVGTSPYGFGATGYIVAVLPLSKNNWDKAIALLNAPWESPKSRLVEKYRGKSVRQMAVQRP